MEHEIKQFILKALAAALGTPMPDGTLRQVTRNAFPHVAITTGELDAIIAGLDNARLIAGTNDEVMGTVWLLTPKGVIRAQALA